MKYTITQISTIEQLYKSNGAETGNIVVDALVEYLQHSSSRKASDAAICLGVERRWLNESIQVFLGVSLGDAIDEWRMLKALDMLDDPQQTIDDVVQRSGYARYNHFSESFQKRWGISPYAYRTGEEPRNALYGCNENAKTRRDFIKRIKELRNRNN